MIYHHIALPVHLADGLLSYSHPTALPEGCRVAVPFRGKTLVGIVWAAGITPDTPLHKILPVQTAFEAEPPLPLDWRSLLSFAARYYHYPLGQAVAAALPQGLKEAKPAVLPEPPLTYALTAYGRTQPPPAERFRRQAALWQALASDGLLLSEARALHPQAAVQLQQWQLAGYVDSRLPAVGIRPSEYRLNDEQQTASQAVRAALGTFSPFLLHGITGSGKTEVYFDIIAEVLAQGRQVLFLLPEINLTPQLLERVSARFAGIPTAVLHSQASAGQRTRDYLRAALGQARLVIGTRLAVFTPLPDAGLIVVDEEHDGSFKQDNDLRYQARDLAVWRAQQAACPVVLGSATPSLESWHKAQIGQYRLLTLNRRARSQARPPHTEILDIRRLPLDNGFAPQTLQLLRDNFRQGGLSLVYLNRRGFAPALFCGDCGHTFGCPRCSAKMVLHRRAHQLHCHHCGLRQSIPHRCPDCGNQDLTAVGHGTQRVEEALRAFLPDARIERVDRDSTAHKSDWEGVYRRIRNGETDILVGTQMLAKGHDFDRLNLVLVLNADGSLYSADFRAPERLFAELMQVSGRAGRAGESGRVLIQTRLPDHPVFAAVRTQDYRLFADNELAERAPFHLPPFGYQAAVRADAANLQEAVRFLDGIKTESAPLIRDSVTVFGAVPMLMMRLAERERAQIFLESPDRRDLHHAVSLWVQLLQQQRSHAVRWSVDIDPAEM